MLNFVIDTILNTPSNSCTKLPACSLIFPQISHLSRQVSHKATVDKFSPGYLKTCLIFDASSLHLGCIVHVTLQTCRQAFSPEKRQKYRCCRIARHRGNLDGRLV